MGSPPKKRGAAPASAAAAAPARFSASATIGNAELALLSALAEPCIILDASSLLVLEANDPASRLYGLSREQLIGMDFAALGAAGAYEITRSKLTQSTGHRHEFAQKRHDGGLLLIEMRPTPVEFQGRAALLCLLHDATSRQKLVRDLLAREATNREIIENVSDIIYTHDFDGNFIWCNHIATELLGYTESDVRKMNIRDVVSPEQLDLAFTSLQAKRTGQRVTETYELDVLCKNGDRITLEVNSRAVMQDGKAVAVQGIARDITQRRRVESALRESEAKFRAVAENAPCAILIYQDERFVYVNPAAGILTGYTDDELMNLDSFVALVTPEFREMVRNRGRQRISGEKVPSRYEFTVTTKSGQERWMDFTASSITYGGRPAGVVLAFDITERKRAEYALMQSEQLFRSLIENSSDIITILDTAAIVRYESPSIASLGFTPAELIGRSGFEFVHPDDLLQARQWFEGAIHQTNTRSVEMRLRHKDGEYRAFEAASNALRDTDRVTGLLISFRDITQRKAAEASLQASEEKYRQLFERNLAGVYASTPDGKLLDCNDSFARIFGYDTREEALAVPTTQFYARGSDRENFLRALRQTNILTNVETLCCKRDGSPIWVLENVSLVSQGEGGEEMIQGTLVDITERKLAEQALIESESKFRAVADTATSAIYIHNGERFLYVNRASQEISGYSEQELLQMHPFSIAHPADRAMVLERARARVIGNDAQLPNRYEFRIFTKSGETRWLDFSASTIQFGGENAILATAFNITERKRVEAMQSAMYRISEIATITEDLDEFFAAAHRVVSQLMYANNLYIALWDPISGSLSFPYFVDEVDKAPDESYFTGRGMTRFILRTGQPLRVTEAEFQEMVKAGEVESVGAPSVDWMGAPFRAGNQTFGAIVVQSYVPGVFYNDHDLEVLNFVAQHLASTIIRKRNEEALRDSEQRYRELVQSAVYGIFRSSTRDNFLEINPALVRLLGYDSVDEVLALNLATDVYADKDERNRIVREYAKGGSIEGLEVRWKRKDSKIITVRLSGRAVINLRGETEAFEMIAEDVTERRLLEDQLRQSQKMEAVGRLAGGIAHDFNNLLTVIKGYSELMLDEIRENDPLRSEVEEIKKAADRAATLTRQLLAFSRQQVLEPRVLDLNSVVSNMEKLLRRLLGEDVQLHTALSASLGRVKADPGQIEQVIMNLAVNARDAMPNGGRLTVETSNVDLDDTYLHDHAGASPGSYVMFAVSDSGQGISQEVQQRIFEPFFTTKELGKGTGLGLSTVYGIVKQSGGYIWVYSELGVGTTFKIYLPRLDAPAEATPPPPPPALPFRGRETVLLVEDEDGVRALVRQVLHKHGYHVLEARHGGEALLHCERHTGKIDLLLTDVVLEQMGGRELAQRLTHLRPDIKVLYISGYTDDAIVAHGILKQGTAFLQKPFTTEALAKKVREVLAAEPRVN